MSTHGYTGVRRFLFDSVAETGSRRTPTPVFFVRASDHPPAPRMSPYAKVLVPLDGTPFAETALTYLRNAEYCFVSQILLLRAVAPPTPPSSADFAGMATPVDQQSLQLTVDQEKAAARRYLAQTAAHYLKGRDTSTRVPVSVTARAIVDAASEPSIELIVMATHGRTGLDRLAHGSVAQHVLHHAAVPVLLLHGVDPRAQVQGTPRP